MKVLDPSSLLWTPPLHGTSQVRTVAPFTGAVVDGDSSADGAAVGCGGDTGKEEHNSSVLQVKEHRLST